MYGILAKPVDANEILIIDHVYDDEDQYSDGYIVATSPESTVIASYNTGYPKSAGYVAELDLEASLADLSGTYNICPFVIVQYSGSSSNPCIAQLDITEMILS